MLPRRAAARANAAMPASGGHAYALAAVSELLLLF